MAESQPKYHDPSIDLREDEDGVMPITLPSGIRVVGFDELLWDQNLAIDKRQKQKGDTFPDFTLAVTEVWLQDGDTRWNAVDRKTRKPLKPGVPGMGKIPANDVVMLQYELVSRLYPALAEMADPDKPVAETATEGEPSTDGVSAEGEGSPSPGGGAV